ncbi:MAG: Wzz/FepE/Etk N-terminal domain-containing protein, partial [Thermoleophilaceae bacterium]
MPASETPGERLTMYVEALRRHRVLVACIVFATVMAGLVVATLAPKSYDATAKVLIGQRAQLDALLGAPDYTPDPERDVNTSVELITLEPVAESVSRRLGLGLSPGALTSKVETATAGNSNVVSITVRDGSPARAARIANAFAQAYRDFRTRAAQASLNDAIARAGERAVRLPSGPERETLDAELRKLQATAAFQTGGVQIVRRATGPSAVASRRLLPSAILAGFLGVILATVAVVVLARTDKRVRSADDLEAAARHPVLATVAISPRRGLITEGRDSLATLALALALRENRPRRGRKPVKREPSPRVLLLASPGPREGTTQVTLGLAQALGEMGRRVVAIEADFREPAFAAQLGLRPAGGLASVLSGIPTLDEELVELPLSSGRGASVWALPAGSTSSPPQPLLAGFRMAALVAEASGIADLVLLAGAPLGPFGDSIALVPLADVALLVGRLDVTRRDQAGRAVRMLEELEIPLLGAVATAGAPADPAATRRVPATPREGAPAPDRIDHVDPSANGSGGRPETPTEVS